MLIALIHVEQVVRIWQVANNIMKKGFTIIELVIVIAIIAVLSGVLISVINPETFRNKSQDARRKADLTAIQGALEVYFADNNAYPVEAVAVSSCTPADWTFLGSTYISVLPVDPDNAASQCYYYITDATGLNYELRANLEVDTASEQNDGGNDAALYEVGTNLSL